MYEWNEKDTLTTMNEDKTEANICKAEQLNQERKGFL